MTAFLWTELRFAFYKIKLNIRSATEMRGSFALQVAGMVLNNVSFVAVWMFFFSAFGSVNGWTAIELIGLQGMLGIVFGITDGFFGGVYRLPEIVNNGSFDSTLLSPRSLYASILTSSTRISALGDIGFGLLLCAAYVVLGRLGIAELVTLISLLLPATCIMINVSLAASLVAFVVPDSEKLAKNMFEAFFSPALYPSGLFHGALRTIFIFIVPSLAIAGLPIDLLKKFDARYYTAIWILAVAWFFIAQTLLGKAVRRYESGNLTGARI